MDKFVKDKIAVTCQNLKNIGVSTAKEINELLYAPCGYKDPEERPAPDTEWKIFGRNDRVYGKDSHYWFKTEIDTPPATENDQLTLEIVTGREGDWDGTNPQALLFLDGEIVQGIDINHREAVLEPNRHYDVLLYFYIGMVSCHIEVKVNIRRINKKIRKLYYDMHVPFDAAMCYPEDDYTHVKTIKCLEHACNMIDFRQPGSKEFLESVDKADEYLMTEYYGKLCGNTDAVVNYIGHTHIDVAWLWTLDQTREKTQRSFATVLALMDRYPDYVFMSSQPQLYAYLKEEEPALFERVKQKVKEGRWEAEGAMWLEADCNLSSGESLVRQILHGKEFMKNELGVDNHILWLPDVFGYSAALPQILRKSGVDTFVTSKISWNESNKMPFNNFMWEGIDGTEIFSHFLTAQTHNDHVNGSYYATYVGMVSPQMNLGTWENLQHKEYSDEAIVTFGYGDGGGGPTEDMIEVERRLEYGLPGMPKAQMSFAGDFLARTKKKFEETCKFTGRTPKWVGELYLEFHRGTYTSAADNKKNNRTCEYLCQTTETVAVTDKLLNKTEYPYNKLHGAWETILLNQFHDIIPGSSINEVYRDSDSQYAEIRETVSGLKNERLADLASNVSDAGVLVYNPNSFEVSGYVKAGEKTVYAKVPSLGYAVVKESPIPESRVKVTDKTIESGHYKIVFNDNMEIISLFDKDNNREVVAEGESFNKLCTFEDFPRAYDNWEITNYYKQKMYPVDDLVSVEPVHGAGFGGLRIKKNYLSSVIVQTVKVYDDDRRIDVENEIDWKELHILLKAIFPTNVHATHANYEIQFGNVERPNHENTSWDAAKFEVCAHKWADLSEDNFGVSILNNCKFGHSALGSTMTLTLLKCGTYPAYGRDHGHHSFTYSIYPHSGDFRKGGTIREAYELNRPLEAVPAVGGGKLPSSFSLISCDSENVIVETVKQAENGDGIIVRMYENWNRKTNAVLHLGFDANSITLCNLMEEDEKEIGAGNTVTVPMGNYEIITLRIRK